MSSENIQYFNRLFATDATMLIVSLILLRLVRHEREPFKFFAKIFVWLCVAALIISFIAWIWTR